MFYNVKIIHLSKGVRCALCNGTLRLFPVGEEISLGESLTVSGKEKDKHSPPNLASSRRAVGGWSGRLVQVPL